MLHCVHSPQIPGADTILSGKSLLMMGGNQVGKMFFNGTDMANGIACDVWKGCVYVASSQITLSVTYWFSSEFYIHVASVTRNGIEAETLKWSETRA